MKHVEGFQGKSQYDDEIDKHFQPSACGPVTAFTIIRHHLLDTGMQVNDLYRMLGGTRIGLFKWRFIRNLRRLLGSGWRVEECQIEDVKKEIDEGRPVAAKFDKWFSFHWFGNFAFDYHWVPVIGYKESESGLILLVHDNGGRNRDSRIREIAYEPNRSILSFIKIIKTTADK
ncbi:C39 family peptidase [Sporosarcina sp. Marseille-Q4943]|uniref:C39 family peptidase n=1 Tax=Sporosarcina sp. Marseille-Q4943 TaxID=2942204 RepID=UPI00208DCB3E|nr:C39 family peptidase [Sporosarcina sp. Marseille-Q4943]